MTIHGINGLAFVHVPKTGGTTMRLFLEKCKSYKKFGKTNHQPYDLSFQNILTDRVVFANIRNPWDYVLSWWWGEHPGKWLIPDPIERLQSFRKWLQEDKNIECWSRQFKSCCCNKIENFIRTEYMYEDFLNLCKTKSVTLSEADMNFALDLKTPKNVGRRSIEGDPFGMKESSIIRLSTQEMYTEELAIKLYNKNDLALMEKFNWKQNNCYDRE